MSTYNFPFVWDNEVDSGLLGGLFDENISTLPFSSTFPVNESYNSPFLENNKPSDGSLLKLNAPISIFGGGGYSYTYDVKMCDSGTQVLELYNKTNPQDNQMIMICEETNANKSNLFGTFLLVKFGKDYREMLYKLKNKEKISLTSTKGNSIGIRINSFDNEITDNLNILKKLFNSDVDFDKVKFAIESELSITSSNGMLLKTIFGGLEDLIEYVTETLNEQFEKIKFTEHDYIPQKAEAKSNIVELIEYLNDVQEKGLKTIIDFVLPADIQQMVSQSFDSALNSIASYAKKELPSGVTKLLEKAYKTIQEGLQFFKEFSEKIANFVGEVALHFKALLMGFVNGLLSTVQMLIQIIGWLIKQMTKLDEKLTGESYRNKQDTFEFIEDLIDLISEQSGAFFAGVASLLADFSFEKMKELFSTFSGSTSKLTSYHYAYYAGSFIFEVVLAVVLAFFTGGASAIAQAASASEKAMATIRLVAREAFSVATMGAIDILKLVRILIAKFAQACKNGWTGFTSFLKKLLSNNTDEIVREEGRLLDELPVQEIIRKFGKITKEIMKKEIPKDFLNALKKFGRTEDEILEYYTKYHNENNFIFLNQIDEIVNNGKNISKTDAFALWSYTTNHYYWDLNNWLRNGINVNKTKQISQLISNALEKMPKYNGQAFRALEFNNEILLQTFLKTHKKGVTVDYNDFVSCGSNTKAAFFDKAKKNVFLKLEVKNAPIISDFSDGVKIRDYAREELLLLRGRKFKVKNIETIDNKHLITLIEM